jgi:hypothetical protein
MTSRYMAGVLIITLGLALTTPVAAQSGKIGYSGPILGPIVGAGAAVALLIIVAVHYSKKRSITGCVAAGGNGMTITDEKGQRIYSLSGNTTGAKPGDRMKLKGKKAKHRASDTAPVWETTAVNKDLGVCQP